MTAPVAPAAARVDDAADYRQRPCADDPAETADAAFELRETRVDAALHGVRLDKALVTLAGEFSRNHLQSLIEAGHLCIDGQVVTLPARKLRAGMRMNHDRQTGLAVRPRDRAGHRLEGRGHTVDVGRALEHAGLDVSAPETLADIAHELAGHLVGPHAVQEPRHVEPPAGDIDDVHA